MAILLQAAALVEPGALEKDPNGQGLQDGKLAAPSIEEYVPAKQSMQLEEFTAPARECTVEISAGRR